MVDTSPSALVVRLDGIGDALALTPLVAALRERGIRVSAVMQERNAQALSTKAFDRVHVADFHLRDRSAKNRKAVSAFAREQLRPERYDYALIATEDFGGYAVAREAGIARRIGFENGWGKPLKSLLVRGLCTRTVRRTAGLDPRAPHECAVLFELGRTILGTQAKPTRDAAVLRPLVLDREAVPDPRLAVQVTDKWMRLGAGFDDIAALVRALHTYGDIRLLASAAESPFADALGSAVGMRVETFTSLPTWKAAIAASRVLVAPDSGAIHVAGMTGTPVVGCFSTKDFALQTARWMPWAAPNETVAMSGEWVLSAAKAAARLRLDTTATL